MSQHDSTTIRKPRTDDRPLWDVVLGVYGYPAVLLAHRLKLFPLLAEKPRTLQEVCDAVHIARRPAEALLSVSASLGLMQVQDGYYSLTPVSEDYLLESSPTYFGGELDLTIANASVWSLESLEKAVGTDTAQVYGGGREMFQSHAEQAELARTFTRAVHSTSMGPALAWPDTLDLSGHRLMLDVGGARARTASARCDAGQPCRPWSLTPRQYVRSPKSLLLATACRGAFAPRWGICGRTPSRPRISTSIR